MTKSKFPLEISASWLCRSFHCLIIRKFTKLWDFSFAHCCCCCLVTKLRPTLCNPHGLQHARLLCPPLSPRVCSNSCLLSQWCYLTISSSAALFSFCLQFSPESGSFPSFTISITNINRQPRILLSTTVVRCWMLITPVFSVENLLILQNYILFHFTGEKTDLVQVTCPSGK